MTDLVTLTIAEGGRLLRSGAASIRELTEATLRRIGDTEPVVHAYAHIAADAAVATASALDADLRAGRDRGPLHGIPIGVKDMCQTVDMPTKAGSRVPAGVVPPMDATVVSRLRAAGAIIVGKTVTHEFAYGQNTPPTRNPWDTSCYPGGSSVGSGVAVVSRSAFAGIGTDTGGSIRIPASVNGVVGLKPTYGRVSRHGVIPLSPSLDHVGPLTRTVEDCALVLDAISAHDAADPTSRAVPVSPSTADLDRGARGTVIGVERDFFFGGALDPEVSMAVEAALEHLHRQGARVVELELPELRLMPAAALTIMLVEASAHHGTLLRERGDDYEPGTRMMLELGALLPSKHHETAKRARVALRQAMRSAFERYALDALLAPSTPQAAVPLDELSVGLIPDERAAMTLAEYVEPCFPANLTGQPAISVPCGFNGRGLPVGFQLIGRPFQEPVLLRLAHAYERDHDWHTRAPELTLSGS